VRRLPIPFAVLATLAGCASGAGPERPASVAAEAGPPTSVGGHGAVRAAFCDRPTNVRLRADLSALFGVPEGRAQAEFCSRFDRAVASGRLSAGQAGDLLRGGQKATVDMLLALADDGRPAGRRPVGHGRSTPAAEPARGDAGDRTAVAADIVSAKRFVGRMIELADGFDAGIANLYSDTAKITNQRTYPDGTVRKAQLTGTEYKQLIKRSMPLAKRDGDRSIYSNVDISVSGNKAFIKADRYSTLKCYTAKGYMVIERDAHGRYAVVEEYGESQSYSSCFGA
jgi:hypothetical protein